MFKMPLKRFYIIIADYVFLLKDGEISKSKSQKCIENTSIFLGTSSKYLELVIKEERKI